MRACLHLYLLPFIGDRHSFVLLEMGENSMFDVSIYADAHDQPSLMVPIVRATPETLSGYGKLVPDFDSEEVILSTWPKTGWRSLAPGTGNHQVLPARFRSRQNFSCLKSRARDKPTAFPGRVS